MTSEYWKSNPRKYCEFCKCWIADNKPSVEFHERGKRHKENVQTKLEEIGRKGKEDYENKLKEDDYMKEMEKAALKAYKADIEKNPDFTGARIAELAESSNAKIVISGKGGGDAVKTKTKPNKSLKWVEAKSPEGYSYYWNKDTGESVWEAPKEGYESLKDQEQQNTKMTKVKKKKEKPIAAQSSSQETVPQPVYGPVQKIDPYGSWEDANPPVEEVDLQLPSLPDQEYYVPELVIKKPEVKFKEKVVTLSNEFSSGPISFKKRKGGDEHKKNVRRRLED